MLFHVSDRPAITLFEPRQLDTLPYPAVWAITEARLCNYLLPRDCPRVTYHAISSSNQADIERFGASPKPSVAIESAWEERARDATVYLYRFDSTGFELVDENAGYYVSRAAVAPTSVETITDLPMAIANRGGRLLVEPSLWPLRDAIAVSTLGFSMIRMRNAQPRLD